MRFLNTDSSDLHGVRRARDVVYMRQLGRALGVLGAWPGEGHVRVGFWRRMVQSLCILFIFAPSFFTCLHHNLGADVRRLGNIVITCLLLLAAGSKNIMFFSNSYWELIAMFLDEIHLFNHKHQNELFFKEHIAVHVRCKTMWRSMSVLLCVGIMLYNAHPLYMNVANGAYSGADVIYEYSVYFFIPYLDLDRQFVPHVVFAVLNIGICCWCVSTNWLPDLLSMKMVIHIWGHMRVLGNEMKSFTEDIEDAAQDKGLLDQQESAAVRKSLKYFVDNHRKILSYVKKMNETFSRVYFFYFLYFQTSLCIMMWQCSQGMEGFVQYGILTVSTVLSLSLLCVVMEMIATENDALARSVYALPWQLMRIPERRTVLIMLMRVQLPLRMKALGLTDVGVSTMAAILKTSISYFMFLRSKA